MSLNCAVIDKYVIISIQYSTFDGLKNVIYTLKQSSQNFKQSSEDYLTLSKNRCTLCKCNSMNFTIEYIRILFILYRCNTKFKSLYLALVSIEPLFLYRHPLSVTQPCMVGHGLYSSLTQVFGHCVTFIPNKATIHYRVWLIHNTGYQLL